MNNNQWYYKRVEREGDRKGYYYLAMNTCVLCGVEFNSGNVSATKYCEECGKKIRAEQNRERVRRCRENKKKQNVELNPPKK